MADAAVNTNGRRLAPITLDIVPEKVSEDTSLGVFQGTVRAVLLVKIKTILKTAAMKSFNPGKVSMFQELKVCFKLHAILTNNNLPYIYNWVPAPSLQASARRRNLSVLERCREIHLSEGASVDLPISFKCSACLSRLPFLTTSIATTPLSLGCMPAVCLRAARTRTS
jgi:hypothetical protein